MLPRFTMCQEKMNAAFKFCLNRFYFWKTRTAFFFQSKSFLTFTNSKFGRSIVFINLLPCSSFNIRCLLRSISALKCSVWWFVFTKVEENRAISDNYFMKANIAKQHLHVKTIKFYSTFTPTKPIRGNSSIYCVVLSLEAQFLYWFW